MYPPSCLEPACPTLRPLGAARKNHILKTDMKLKLENNNQRAVEHVLDLHSIGQFIGRLGEDLGAIISRRGERFIVKFGFDWEGTHSDISIDESVALIEANRQFCKEMPEAPSTLKIEWSAFNNTTESKAQLNRLYDRSDDKIRAFIASDKKKLAQISSINNKTGSRVRKPSQIRMWASYSVKVEELDLKLSEKALLVVENGLKKISGEAQIDREKAYHKFLLNSYSEGLLAWIRAFATLPSKIQPLTSTQVWHECYLQQNRFKNTQAKNIPAIPHLTVVNMFEKRVEEILSGKDSIKGVLTFGNNALPIASSQSVYVDRKHITALSLTAEAADNDQGYPESFQLNYIGELLQQYFMYDCRIVLEFGKDDQDKAAANIIDARQEAIARSKEKQRGGKRSIASEDAVDDLIEAERSLSKDGVHMIFGLTFFVYRDTTEKSLLDAQKISDYFQYPAKCSIEQQVTFEYWISSLPWSIRPVMSDRFSRRLKTSGDWMPSYFPSSRSVGRAKSGATMFLSHYGKEPLFFNQELQERRGHGIILGRSGCGKSFIAAYLILAGLAEGRDATIIDTPTSKQASTFKMLAYLLDCPYIDILDPDNAWNFFETPYIAKDDPDRGELLEDFKKSVSNILYAMIMGDPNVTFDGVIAGRYTSIISKGLKSFFSSHEIMLLYESAKRAGMGTTEWASIPTLETFETHLTAAKLGFTTTAEKDALTSVKACLRSWIDGPYGQVLARPSRISFRNKKLAVIGLRDITNPAAAVTWSAITDAIVNTRSMLARKRGSLAFFDELGVKLKYPAFAEMYVEALAISRKNNCYIYGATQSPGVLDPQQGSKLSNTILTNIRYKFIGSIEPGAIESYARIAGLEPHQLEPLCTEGFRPNYKDKISSWMLAESSYVNYIDVHISDLLVAAIGNEEHERQALKNIIGDLPPDRALAVLYNSIYPRKKSHEKETNSNHSRTHQLV
jgi:hypothetical protein